MEAMLFTKVWLLICTLEHSMNNPMTSKAAFELITRTSRTNSSSERERESRAVPSAGLSCH